jgi:cytochrome c oxidase assembly protein subunit 15
MVAVETTTTNSARDGTDRAVAVWLFIIAGMIAVMVLVGGLTRLTGSGLSITEWRPVTGAIPPLSDADWQAEFARYQGTPQYDLLNRGMGLVAFKTI